MAELVDALVSGTSGRNTLEVRVFLCPPKLKSGFFNPDFFISFLNNDCIKYKKITLLFRVFYI